MGVLRDLRLKKVAGAGTNYITFNLSKTAKYIILYHLDAENSTKPIKIGMYAIDPDKTTDPGMRTIHLGHYSQFQLLGVSCDRLPRTLPRGLSRVNVEFLNCDAGDALRANMVWETF